jgi:hypothetical protein
MPRGHAVGVLLLLVFAIAGFIALTPAQIAAEPTPDRRARVLRWSATRPRDADRLRSAVPPA